MKSHGKLLHVLTAAPATPAQAEEALRALRRLAPESAALLLCDLPDADAAKTPQDDPLCRLLQSGVMALDARVKGRRMLLVRRRVWDDAARAYLGAGQRTSPRQTAAELMTLGKAQAVFEAASFAPGALRGQYAAALFSSVSLTCTPDTPARMLRAAQANGCVRAAVHPRRLGGEPILSRLTAQGFDVSPLRTALRAHLAPRGCALADDGPALFAGDALARLADGTAPAVCPLEENCVFVARRPPALSALLHAARERFARAYDRRAPDSAAALDGAPVPAKLLRAFPLACAVLPIAQMALLLLAALLGFAPLTFLAVALPEAYALVKPRLLPGALVRTALLPLLAALSLDALLCRWLARSRVLRLRLSGMAFTPGGCALCGGLLIPLAFWRVSALPGLLAVGLLWLAAPSVARALALPARERIPLDGGEQSELRALAEAAFYDSDMHAPPAAQILCACGGCMLGQLEPDEAARRAQAALSACTQASASAAELCCLLAGAQYLRERMADCDAALRPLPAAIEDKARALSLESDGGLLCALMRAAREGASLPASDAHAAQTLDALFLPPRLAFSLPPHNAALPLTHPHTFLRRALPPGDAAPTDGAARFLYLCAAALGHPFAALLWRSPIAAPYEAIVSLV